MTRCRQKQSFRDIVRRTCSADLAQMFSNVKQYIPRKTIHAISKYLPKLRIIFPRGLLCGNRNREVNLDILYANKKGKCAIYSSAQATFTKDDIYVSYLGRQRIIKYIRKGLAAGNIQKDTIDPCAIDQLSNRWCVTWGKPVTKIRTLSELRKRLIIIERYSSKQNHPPVGSTHTDPQSYPATTSTWVYSSALPSGYREDRQFVCTVTHY